MRQRLFGQDPAMAAKQSILKNRAPAAVEVSAQDPFDEMAAKSKILAQAKPVEVVTPALDVAAPKGGSYLGGASMAAELGSGATAGDIVSKGSAAATPFLATPWGAAALIGGQLIGGAMQQSAQADQAKRQREMEIALNLGQSEQQGFRDIANIMKGALG